MNMPISVMTANPSALRQAASMIQRGGLVAMPTETVYGLGCDAFNEHALAKVFEAKARPRFDPLIVHGACTEQAWALVWHIPQCARDLAEAFWPGPMTLVLPKADHVPDLATSGMPTVAVRVPGHPVARQLIEAAACPIAAPSANRFGGISPTTAQHVAEQFGQTVPIILDGGPCQTGVESTVISVVEPDLAPTVLRLGGLTLERIQAVVGEVHLPGQESEANIHAQANAQGRISPGMLRRHYAPHTPLRFVDDKAPNLPRIVRESGLDQSRCGVLMIESSQSIGSDWAAVEVLSQTGDLTQAAANLFAALHRLDHADLEQLFALAAPDHGLGRAINDRLRRAAAD